MISKALGISGAVLAAGIALGGCASPDAANTASSDTGVTITRAALAPKTVGVTELTESIRAAMKESGSVTSTGSHSLTLGDFAVTVDQSGSVDFANQQGTGSIRTDTQLGIFGAEMRAVDGVAYVKTDVTGPQWIVLDPSEYAAEADEARAKALEYSDQINSLLTLVEDATTITLVATQAGEQTTTYEYQAEVDVDALREGILPLIAEFGNGETEKYLDMAGDVDVTVAPFRFTLDADNRLLSASYEVSATTPNGTSLAASGSMSFSDYGAPVTVSAPPADETVPAEELELPFGLGAEGGLDLESLSGLLG